MNEHAILHRPVDVAHLPTAAVEVVADSAERLKLAKAYDLLAVNGLTATATFAAGARGSVQVDGRVVADIVQTCVVSLVPVDQHIDEPFSIRFVRPEDAPTEPKPGAEVVIDADRPDPPEVLADAALDLGAIVEEAFVLAIDPYPRAPGAVLPAGANPPQEAGSVSPFAVLAGLAGRTGKSA
jgi:uncharacterized metal-binding protein YceD (DUF177 family)